MKLQRYSQVNIYSKGGKSFMPLEAETRKIKVHEFFFTSKL